MKNDKKLLYREKVWWFFVFLLVVFSVPSGAHAARLSLDTKVAEVGVGQLFEVSVYAHSEGETVNAFAGTVHIPSLITPRVIRDGDSLIALWETRPEISQNDITFAGIIPGGWRGTNGLLFSFVVEATTAGNGEIGFSDAVILLHDGKGTTAPLSLITLSLRANANIPLTEFANVIEDHEPPEAFTLKVERDDDLFSGNAFLVFTAQDKGSGIDHYEILETR